MTTWKVMRRKLSSSPAEEALALLPPLQPLDLQLLANLAEEGGTLVHRALRLAPLPKLQPQSNLRFQSKKLTQTPSIEVVLVAAVLLLRTLAATPKVTTITTVAPDIVAIMAKVVEVAIILVVAEAGNVDQLVAKVDSSSRNLVLTVAVFNVSCGVLLPIHDLKCI